MTKADTSRHDRNSPRRSTPGLPTILAVPAVVGSAFFALPFVGLLLRTPWARLPSLLAQPIVGEALWLSLTTSFLALAISMIVGVPLAYALAWGDFRGRGVLRAVVTLPMVLPPVVGGTALLFAFGRRGVFGAPVDDLVGLSLPFTLWGVVAANVFVAMPFLVVTVESAMASMERDPIAAAQSLGASELLIARRVVLPSVAGAVRAGALLTWARALGEFGATVTFAGNLQGRTQTLPLAVFVARETDRDAAIAISLVLIAVAVAVLVALRGRWWSQA